jgi:anti-anti-sigma factor
MTLSVAPDPVAHGVLVALWGDLDLSTFGVFDEQHRVHTRECVPMRVDLSGVDYIDSAGLACLMLARRRATEHRVRLVFESPSHVVARALELAGVRQWLEGGPEPAVVPIETRRPGGFTWRS